MQHYGIHSLTIEGDRNEGLKYIGQAQKVIDQLQGRLKLGGIQSGADWKDLGDGAFLYARVAMGVNAVRIVVPDSGDTEEQRWKEDFGPPDFLSGAVVGAVLEEVRQEDGTLIDVLRSYWPAIQSQRKFDLLPGLQRNARLAVAPDFVVTAVLDSGTVRRSQHAGVKPSMYSGAMKKVVQLLLGYGLPGKSLYQRTLWHAEGEQGQKSKKAPVTVESMVRYDFRAYRTHGISFAPDGKPWVIEISAVNGVVGMPLELHPETTTTRFRGYLERKGDEEALVVLDLLGGFPTGKGFPMGKAAMKAMITSGYAVRLMEPEQLAPFYNLEPYSSALGWAFNELGTEAHNTCFGWDETDWQFGEHHAITISIGQPIEVPVPARAAELRAHLTGVLGDGATNGDSQAFDYNMRKIARITDEEVESLLRMAPAQAYAELSEIQATPIAACRANLTRVSRGALINGDYETPYQAKFWEPLMDNAVITHDFSPAEEEPRGKPATVSDTTILAYFDGNALKTVKWFSDSRRKAISHTESDEEDCMYAGNWTSTTYSGMVGPAPGYYSSDYDLRTETPDSTTVRMTKGEDLGWTSCDADWPQDWPVGGYCSAWRTRSFKMQVEQRSGMKMESVCAFVWPAFAREAYYLAERKTKITAGHSLGFSYKQLGDPNVGELFIPYSTFSGAVVDLLEKCGNSSYRRVVRSIKMGSGCSDLVDEGEWLSECEVIDNKLFNTPLPPLPEGFSRGREEVIEYEVYFSSGYYDDIKVAAESDAWFDPSPLKDDGAALQYMYVTGNCLGDAESVVYSTSPSGPLLQAGYPDFPQLRSGVPCFIGVNL